MSNKNTPEKPGTPMTPIAAERIEKSAEQAVPPNTGDHEFAERARKAAERNVTAGIVRNDGDTVRK